MALKTNQPLFSTMIFLRRQATCVPKHKPIKIYGMTMRIFNKTLQRSSVCATSRRCCLLVFLFYHEGIVQCDLCDVDQICNTIKATEVCIQQAYRKDETGNVCECERACVRVCVDYSEREHTPFRSPPYFMH